MSFCKFMQARSSAVSERVKQEAEVRRQESLLARAKRQAEEEEKQRQREAMAQLIAEEKARQQAEEAEEELRKVEAELKLVEEASRQAEEREASRRNKLEAHLASETRLREDSLQKAPGQDPAPPPPLGAGGVAVEKDEAEAMLDDVLEEMHAVSVEELLLLAPNASRQQCRGILERCDWNVSIAACELLAMDSPRARRPTRQY